MEKILKFTEIHWRKFAVLSVPIIYGFNYIRKDYQNKHHMRNVCNVANQYAIAKTNRVLVVLNPVANKEKCEKVFKKYYEPVLHMAGFMVDIVRTKHVGHAKSLMEELEQLPDIVVVAGGDGTSSEVVTGLLRRKAKICPILLLPLGENNKTPSKIMQSSGKSNFDTMKNVSQCMLPLVQCKTQSHTVMKYELVGKNYQDQTKPIFGISSFSWGVLKDIETNKDKYWYFGAWNRYASAVFAVGNNKLHHNISAKILSKPPCSGCKECEHAAENKSVFNISNLLNLRVPNEPTIKTKEHEQCSTENCYDISAKQIDITCKQRDENFFALSTDIIENIASELKFLSNILKGNEIQPSSSFESHTLEIIPTKTADQTFYIDGEGYDARRIKLSFLPNAVKFFTLAHST